MPEIGAVSAALMGAVAYGAGDFAGGRAALRLSTFSAVAIAQTVAMALMLQQFLSDGGDVPSDDLLKLSLVAGLAYSMGLMLLYHGFAHGRIGIVAPLCGLFGILIPLGGELVAGEGTTEWHLVGISLCAIAVVLIAGSAAGCEKGRVGFSIRTGIVSGVGYGVADLCLGIMPAEAATGSLFVTRSVAAFVATSLLLVSILGRMRVEASSAAGLGSGARADLGPSQRVNGLHLGVMLAILAGVFDMLGHVGYVTAAVDGNMGVAAALVALFPAVSVALAILFLNESVTRRQVLGFAFGGFGIFMVTD